MEEEKTFEERWKEKLSENGRRSYEAKLKKHGAEGLKKLLSKAGKKGANVTNKIKKEKAKVIHSKPLDEEKKNDKIKK